MSHTEINLALQRASARILANFDLLGDQTETLQRSFIKGFYDVLKQSFRVNIDTKKFEEFVDSPLSESEIEEAVFVGKTVENESTYILLNYYILTFLQGLAEYPRYEAAIANELDKQLDASYSEVVIDSYKKFISNDRTSSAT